MKIVGVTACTAGIAHTYIVKEKLEQAARKLGYTCRIETQGSIGIEEQLTPEDHLPTEEEAKVLHKTFSGSSLDVIILAIDVKISGENRFKGKPVVRMSTEKAMKNTGAMLQSIEEALTKKKNGGN